MTKRVIPLSERRCTKCGQGVADGATFRPRPTYGPEATNAQCTACINARDRAVRAKRKAAAAAQVEVTPPAIQPEDAPPAPLPSHAWEVWREQHGAAVAAAQEREQLQVWRERRDRRRRHTSPDVPGTQEAPTVEDCAPQPLTRVAAVVAHLDELLDARRRGREQRRQERRQA